MVSNKLRVHISPDPYCQVCPSAEIQDVYHFFINCERVRVYWNWVRDLCIGTLGVDHIDDDVLLKFYWSTSSKDQAISWLVSHYIFIVWDMLYKRRLSSICKREFFGFLTYKYKEALSSNMVSIIAGL